MVTFTVSKMRRNDIENDLQNALENGHNVWAIGDVHGFSLTLEALLDACELTMDDRVVLLGDLIDRGPDSFDVVRIARSDPRIHCVKGNHEDMMVDGFKLESLKKPDSDMATWLHNGGYATVASYIRDYTDDFGHEDSERLLAQVEDDRGWMQRLPSHLILDQWRLVHAGYDPRPMLKTKKKASICGFVVLFIQLQNRLINTELYCLATRLQCRSTIQWAQRDGVSHGIQSPQRLMDVRQALA